MTSLVEIVNRGPDTETTERLAEAASPDRIELLCRGLSLPPLSPSVERIMAIEPYKINVPETAIERLRQKLATTDLPDELDEVGWDMGSPLGDIRRLVSFWENRFDWREIESELNKLPHFQTSVQCDGFDPLDIHFVHQRSSISGAIPLLFCHGCEASCQTAQLVTLLIILQGLAVSSRSRNSSRFSPTVMATVP